MSAEQKHVLLVLPGFQADTRRLEYLQKKTTIWKSQGISSLVVPVAWEEGTFAQKLGDLVDVIDAELQSAEKLSLLGVSAGGILSVAGLIERPGIHKAVTVSARLRDKNIPGYASAAQLQAVSPSAAEGIHWLDRNKKKLTPELKAKILNTRSSAGDMQVHPSMSFIEGANNVWMPPSRDHIDAVSSAITKHGQVIVDFLQT